MSICSANWTALGLVMPEQPLGWQDLINQAKLQREFDTPICLDETITAPAIAKRAVTTDATRWVNIGFRRGGGLTNAIAIQRYCIDLPCWVDGKLESFVGRSASLAFATLPGKAYVADIFPAGRLYEKSCDQRLYPQYHDSSKVRQPASTLVGEDRGPTASSVLLCSVSVQALISTYPIYGRAFRLLSRPRREHAPSNQAVHFLRARRTRANRCSEPWFAGKRMRPRQESNLWPTA